MNRIFIFENPEKHKKQKEDLLNQKGRCFWMYGLSGAGKSTLASFLEEKLLSEKYFVICLDGDVVRNGINSDLGFSESDRLENIRRVAEMASLLVKNGVIVIVTLVCPLKKMRELARQIIGKEYFTEIFIEASLEVCKKRDTKGLYKSALTIADNQMTGLGQSFEEPDKEVIKIETGNSTEEMSKKTLYEIAKKIIER